MTDPLQVAADHLSAADPVFKPLVARHGLCTIQPHDDYYQALVNSIISQQLSVKAASTIKQRLLDLFDGKFPAAGQIVAAEPEQLRAVGLSNAKVRYVKDLAEQVTTGQLDLAALPSQSNAQIIAELVAVKGIGVWTAQMFLIFCLGRLDVLPVGDLGVRTGVMRLYGLPELPDEATLLKLSGDNGWAPYESVAAWYIWRSLDNTPINTYD